MTYLSLFSGVGGFDAGLDRSGMECIGQVEQDRQCLSVLERHWPNVKRITDVRKVKRRSFSVRPDLICGGFPCQDLSVAGRRSGLAGKRSGLFWEMLRVIQAYLPPWFLVENVPGLLSSQEGRDFGLVIASLAELGYGVAWRVLDSQYFGLAQRRDRVFIVGSLGTMRCAEILFEPESVRRDSPPSREAGARVAGTIAGGAHPGGLNGRDAECGNIVNCLDAHMGMGGADDNSAQANHLVASPITAGYAKGAGVNDGPRGSPQNLVISRALTGKGGRFDPNGETYVTHTLRGEGHDASEDGTGRGVPLVAFAQNQRDEVRRMDVAGALAAEPGMKQQTYVMQERMESLNPNNGPNGKGWSDEGVAYTLEARSKAQSVAGERYGVRRLTPIECERLQGFPDDWTLWAADGKEISDSARYRMIGNAVSVPVAEWIGRRLMEASSASRGPGKPV